MLRGAQTPGELKQRTERLHRFDALSDVHGTLEELGRRELVERLERRPGQKEERYRHLLGADAAGEHAATAPEAASADEPSPGLEARVAALEAELREVHDTLDRLLRRLDG